MQATTHCTLTYPALLALAPYLLVKIDGGGNAVVNTSGNRPKGFTRTSALATFDITVHPLELVKETVLLTASGAITADAALYADDGGKVTATDTGAYIGKAMQAASGDGSVLEVMPDLRAETQAAHGTLESVVADPGAAGAIAVTGNGSVQLVSVAAETRTLAAPGYVGQKLSLCLKTDGGDVVVTCATGLNQAGNNTATFNDAGDLLELLAVQVGSAKRWRVAVNDGATLATV